MGNNNEIRVVLGSLRYKSASNTTIGLKLPLIQTAKENIEFDRNINISLAEVFDRERQKSTIFRPTCKFSLLFKNSKEEMKTHIESLKNTFIDTMHKKLGNITLEACNILTKIDIISTTKSLSLN